MRHYIRQKKRAMTEQAIIEASMQLQKMLLRTDLYAAAKTLYAYLSYNQEVRTNGIIRAAMEQGKRVAVPKVFGDQMRFIELTPETRLETGYAGIPEPVEDGPVVHDPTALVLMPGLAFDAMGHRIGYGGGFYDRFLSQEPTHPTVALCYGFQMFPQLEVDEFDVPVDLVLWYHTDIQ